WTTSADGKALTPINNTMDFLLGGTATSSARFAVLNLNPGGLTPVASISANTANNATYLSGDGTLSTTNKQTLTIGSDTGNIVVNATVPTGTGNALCLGTGNRLVS